MRSAADVLRLIIAAALLAIGLVAATWGRNTVLGIEADVVSAYARLPRRLADGLTGVAWIVAGALPLVALVLLLVRRRYQAAAALVVGSIVAGLAMVALDGLLNDRSVIKAVETELGHPIQLNANGFATSQLLASVIAMAVIGSSWLSRRWRRALWSAVAVLTLLRVLSSGEPPLDVIIAFAVGLAVGSLALVVFGSPSFDPDGPALLGLLRRFIRPRRIEQTQSSSPLVYLVTTDSDEKLELRLRTPTDRSADLLDRLWRFVRLRSSETDAPFSTLPRRLEHEALALTMAAKAGAHVRDVHAVVASGSGGAGLLLDHVAGESLAAQPSEQIDQALLVDMWNQVGALRQQRIAHRALGLSQVTAAAAPAPGSPPVAVLGGFDRARLAAADNDLALDTAQLLVDSALRVGESRAVAAAVTALGSQAVVEAVPYMQPLALPTRTRRALRSDKAVLDRLRTEIHKRTDVQPAPLERLDRIRPRTALSIVALAIAFYVLLPQLARAEQSADAARSANWWWLGPILLGSAATYVFAAISFAAAAPGPVSFWSALRLQVASSFVSQIAPANTGGLAAGVRFLQRAGFEPGAATASVGLNAIFGLAVHLALAAAFIAWAGTSHVGGFSLPEANTVLLVVAIVVSASGIVGLITPIRRRITKPLVSHARLAASTLAGALTDPLRVLRLLVGALGVTLCYLLTLAAAVQALGGGVSLPQVGAAYLVASALASAAPTPGGLGALEAALAAGLSGYGMPDSHAISAVLVFRLATFWLPMAPGWVTFQWMQRREEL
ncbi:MAG TPA: lysylphosphatidylglycerol synthase transmembrane domain-containing protein [Acidimicrobiales bacterium]